MLGVVAVMQLAPVAVIRFFAFQYISQLLNHKFRYHGPLHVPEAVLILRAAPCCSESTDEKSSSEKLKGKAPAREILGNRPLPFLEIQELNDQSSCLDTAIMRENHDDLSWSLLRSRRFYMEYLYK